MQYVARLPLLYRYLPF